MPLSLKTTILLLTTIIGVFLLLVLDQYQSAGWREARQLELEKTADILSFRLDSAVTSRIDTARHLASAVTAQQGYNEEQFIRFAERIMEYTPSLRALQITDEETQVVYVYPPRGNMITITDPMVLIEDPLRGEYVRKAIEEEEMTVQPPFELRQGGTGIVARNPMFRSGEFMGLTIAVLDVPVIIEESFPGIRESGYGLSLTDSEGNTFYQMNGENANVVERTVSFADTGWTMRIAVTDGSWKVPMVSRIIVYGLGGGLLALLLFVIRMLFGRAERLEHEVSRRTEELQHSEERLRLLMRELNHRIKNNLAMITSLVRLKSASAPDTVDLSDIYHQIDTIRIVHEKLYQATSVNRIEVGEYLEDLLSTIFSFSDRYVEIDNKAKGKEIGTDIAVPIGLITNEVATNAVKYSFSSQVSARFSVEMRQNGDSYELTLAHSGDPFPEGVDFDNTKTLGLRLIKELATQLDGTVELIRRPSPRFIIRFPARYEE